MTKEKRRMMRRRRKKPSTQARRRFFRHECWPERGLRHQRSGYRKHLSEAGCPGHKELRLSKGKLKPREDPEDCQLTLYARCEPARPERNLSEGAAGLVFP